jgi:hypothetical protein
MKWALLALGLLIGLGFFSAGMLATQDLSPVSNPATNQTVYLQFQGPRHGYVTPARSTIYRFGKFGIFVGAAVAFYGATRFRKPAEPPSLSRWTGGPGNLNS